MQEIILMREELRKELDRILSYWIRSAQDTIHGGFFGRIDEHNVPEVRAPKGAVLNARILWTFSAAYNESGEQNYRLTAERAYKYLRDFFIDREFGGVYWSVNHLGAALEDKKQIYAIAFCIYGLSEYYISTQDEDVKGLAISLYDAIVDHSYDHNTRGYFEAFGRDWQEILDLRLSHKDANEKKTANTHLHILEAFANLYRITGDEALRNRIAELINIFADKIIDKQSSHLGLFYDEFWNSKSNAISYGHDIEAAWLISEAAQVINDGNLITITRKLAQKLADAASRGLDEDGGLWYEYDNGLIKEKHWWPNAEAMVGYFSVWQMTRNRSYLAKSVSSWEFIKQYLLDQTNGEWFWGVREDYSVMEDRDKAGMWKCPYHNARACLEVIRRINTELR